MNPGLKLDGSRALVTGASSGIGRALALGLARRGARLFLVGRDRERLAATAEAAQAEGATAETMAADLARAGERTSTVEECAQRLGPVDLLVNAAGLMEVGRHEGIGAEAVDAMMAVNLLAPVHLASLVLPSMRERGRGCIASVASMSARVPVPFSAAYAASKAGLAAFSEALARELWGTGVLVVVAMPSATRTPMVEDCDAGAARKLGVRFADPDAVAGAVLDAVASGRKQVYPGLRHRSHALMNAFLPGLADRLIARRLDDIARFYGVER